MSRVTDNRDRRARNNNKLNNSIQRNRVMPRVNNMPPHMMDNTKTQMNIHDNPRFCDTFARLKGCIVHVQVKSGITYEGVLNTISQNGEIVLTEASTKDQTVGNMANIIPKLILNRTSIVTMTAKDVDFDYAVKSDTFATDSEIGQRLNGRLPERELEEWCPEDEGIDERLLDCELESDHNLLSKGNGWDANEMFLLNKRKFGYTSTYKEDLKEYTTPLELEDTKEFRERQARAERLAKEIEQSPDHAIRGQIENNDEMTEEERFSSVSRVGHGSNSRPDSMGSSSNNTNKYVPPQKRQPPPYLKGGPPGKASPPRLQNSGPGRPPMMPGDRQPPPQGLNQPYRHSQQPPKQPLPQQQQPPPPPQAIHSNPPAGHTGAMSNDYNSRVQPPPHHHQQQQQVKPHHLPQQQQQSPYQQQRPPVILDRGSPVKAVSPTMSPMGQKPFFPVDHEQQQHSRVPPMLEKPPVPPQSEAVIQRPDLMSHQGPSRPHQQQQQQQIPPLTSETEKSSRTKELEDLKQFSENLTLAKPDISRENKVPPGSTHSGEGKVQPDVIPPQPQQQQHVTPMGHVVPAGGPSVPTEVPPAAPQQPETKVASTSPVSQSPPKKFESLPPAEKERVEVEKVQSPKKPSETKLNPNAKEFVPQRGPPQKTPTPPLSRSPAQQMNPNQMIHHPTQFMQPTQVIYNGQYLVTSNAPAGMQHYPQLLKQQSRGAPRAEYIPSPYPAVAAAAGQPLVAPGQIITVTTGQPGGNFKMVQPVLNPHHMIKQQQMPPYRAMQAANPGAVQAIHPQSQQMVTSTDGVMMPQMMAYQSHAAAAASQSQSLQQPQPHPQGPTPSGHYIHAAPNHTNAASQMQQHHTTPPLQQTQQGQGNNHSVIASQGQFQQHSGRPSPGPMQPQMAHAAQAQGQMVHQPQGGLPQIVAVSQGGQPALVYTSLPQNQHGQGIPNQHASQPYSNIQQHMNQPNMQVQPTNLANITNVTRVHPEPHPHPHPSAVYINQPGMSNQAAMVQGQHPVAYMQQHAYNQPGN